MKSFPQARPQYPWMAILPWLAIVRLCLAAALSGFSQEAEFDYDSRLWQVEDGLPGNDVQAIAQTRDGYLWVGTRRGLVRFDGIRFQPVAELADKAITALAEAHDGTLWVGTDGAGILRYRDGKPLPFSSSNPPDSPGAISVQTMAVVPSGDFWIGTTNGAWRFQDGKFKKELGNLAVLSMVEDDEGGLLLATPDGLRKLKGGELANVPEPGLGSARVVRIGRKGDLWVGGSAGATRVTGQQTLQLTKTNGLAADVIDAIYEDGSGTTWIGTSAGLNRFTEEGGVLELTHEGEMLDSVFAICEDREKNLWIGTRDGLYRLRPRPFTTYTKKQGLSHNNVTSVRGNESRVWIGTYGGGLDLLQDGKITRMPMTNQWFNDLVLGLYLEHNGTLWVGTDREGGMYRRDPNGMITRYWKGQMSNLGDPSVRVVMLDTQKGRIWAGTADGLDVALRRRPFWRYTTENGLANNSVRAVLEDTHGSVWVGTDNGLTQFQDEQLASFARTNGLPNNTVNALYEDEENTLWIGTAGGLARFRLGKFTSYTMRHGMFSDEIFEIVEDNFNRLWMTCSAGIFWVAKRDFDALDAGTISTLTSVSYGKDSGLKSVSCNNLAKPSAWKTPDGRLWFATAKGLSVVDPAVISRGITEPPPVRIEEVLCDRKPYAAEEPLELSPGSGELEFRFTALTLLAPERSRFKYKLEGLDKDWIDAGTRRSAHYNNVYPGNYRFRVLACNSAGVWNRNGATLAFSVSPYFWQTWWFKVLLFLGVCLAAAGLYQVRIARLREMERLRMRIAADLHDEIGSSVGSISLLARKIQKEGSLEEQPKNDLSSIHRIATQTANSIRDIVWFINPQYDTVQDLLLRMKDAAGAIAGDMKLTFTGPQENLSRKLSPDFRRNLFLMFKEILNNAAKHSRATAADIIILDQQGVWVLMVRDDGVGFDLNAATSGSGLKNLQQRAEKLGGSLEIRTQPGGGTTIIFSTNKR